MLRNHKSNISIEVAKVLTRRRAVLTGSPLQNNLAEYHCMIDFINPGESLYKPTPRATSARCSGPPAPSTSDRPASDLLRARGRLC